MCIIPQDGNGCIHVQVSACYLLRHVYGEANELCTKSSADKERHHGTRSADDRTTIEITQEMVRELLWHAIAPNATVLQRELTSAIEQQQSLLDVSLDGYELTGISVVGENAEMYAELTYTLVE